VEDVTGAKDVRNAGNLLTFCSICCRYASISACATPEDDDDDDDDDDDEDGSDGVIRISGDGNNGGWPEEGAWEWGVRSLSSCDV
jgi:hypothetical protein